jgi:signal transduction histidine kinase
LERGIERFRKTDFDLVLLDLNLPDTQGLETLQILRRNVHKVPVIVLTGHDDVKMAMESLSIGANDYLVKGEVDVQMLHRSIRYSIERQQLLMQLEEKWLQMQKEQEIRLLKEKNQEIMQKNKELEEAYRFKSEFLANVSHELKTPLNNILVSSQLILEKDDLPRDKELRLINIIHKSGQDLMSLIYDIMDESKIELGKLEVNPHETDIREVAENMKLLFKPMADQKLIKYNVSFKRGTPSKVVTDKLRLEQIIKNLLANAFSFTNYEGKVDLIIDKYRNDKKNNQEKEQFLTFSVIDNGIGIPPEKHHVIFEAFRQVDSSISRRFEGTGLGLSISHKLAGLLGGKIELQSEPGIGSNFTLYLPVK